MSERSGKQRREKNRNKVVQQRLAKTADDVAKGKVRKSALPPHVRAMLDKTIANVSSADESNDGDGEESSDRESSEKNSLGVEYRNGDSPTHTLNGDRERQFHRQEASGLKSYEEDRLEARAIREGWMKQRFPTHVSKDDLLQDLKSRGGKSKATLAEKLVLSVHDGLKEGVSERRLGIAERNGIAMELSNQRDEHLSAPQKLELSLAPGVAESEDWYGNNAHDLAAQSAAASEAGPAINGEKEGSGLRTQVGQDSARANGLPQGSRFSSGNGHP